MCIVTCMHAEEIAVCGETENSESIIVHAEGESYMQG